MNVTQRRNPRSSWKVYPTWVVKIAAGSAQNKVGVAPRRGKLPEAKPGQLFNFGLFLILRLSVMRMMFRMQVKGSTRVSMNARR